MYRATMVVSDLGWVDIDLGHTIVCLVLPQQMGTWLNRLGSWAKWWNISIKVNPTHVTDHQPHPTLYMPVILVRVVSNRLTLGST